MCQLRCRPPPTTVALQMQEHTTYELSSNAVQYKTCYAGSFLLKNKRQKAENLRKCQSRRLSVQAESRSLSDPFTARERRLLAPSPTITGSILGKMPNWDFAFTAVFSVLIHCCSLDVDLDCPMIFFLDSISVAMVQNSNIHSVRRYGCLRLHGATEVISHSIIADILPRAP